MTPSHYQRKIYYFVEAGRGDGIVNAVAGSGKTTTIVKAANLVRSTKVTFLAFNKDIVKELQRKLGSHVSCKTLNALGHVAVQKHLGKQIDVQDRKYDRIVASYIEQRYPYLKGEPRKMTKRAVLDIVSFSRSSLIAHDDDLGMQKIVLHFSIDIPPSPAPDASEIYQMASDAMVEGEQLAQDAGVIDYDDQIWLPYVWMLKPPPSDFIFVDEAQDLSPAKRELAISARAPGGRMLFVADKNQSIYGFAGADSESVAEIARRTSAAALELSVCYRCPTSHLDLARKLVPAIEAAPDAIVGTIATIETEQLAEAARNGDLILCRLTKPLIDGCLQLIRRKVPARVKGRDLARSLMEVARDALGNGEFADFTEMLNVYEDRKFAVFLKRADSEKKIESLRDQVGSLRALHEAFADAKTFEEFKASVNSIFSDDQATIEFSTIHRAKGLEADRVFILEPHKTPLIWKGQQPWEFRQELNLLYVALTRSRSDLFFVGDPSTLYTELSRQEMLRHAA